MTSKKLIVFDLDGTLVDSMSGFADVAQEVIAHLYCVDPLWAREHYRATSGLPFPLQLEAIFPGHPLNPQAVEKYDSARASGYAKAPFFADVFPALEVLKDKGVRLAVSSNNYQNLLDEKIDGHRELFDEAFGFSPPDFLKGKRHFEKLEKTLGVSSKEILFVGDSLHDAKTAQACGIDFVARTGTFTRKQFEEQGIALQIVDDLLCI